MKRKLFHGRGLVLLLLDQLPGTGAGLTRRANEIDPTSPAVAYEAIGRLAKEGLIRLDGTAGRRGGGRRYVITDAGRELAAYYRRGIAAAASTFPLEGE